jgi:hypothetical protein
MGVMVRQPEPEPTKRCYHCGQRLPLADFCRDSGSADGRNNKCRVCVALLRNGEEDNARRMDPEAHRLGSHRYYLRHQAQICEQRRERYWREKAG